MYKTRSASGGSMGSLRRDYVARIPIDLNCSPLSSKAIHAASAATHHRYGGTARLLIGGGGGGPDVDRNGGGVSLVRCRVDSDNSPTVIGFSDDDDDDYDYTDGYHVTPPQRQQKPQETMMTSSSSGGGDVSVRSWSTSSEGRETGSILKKPEYGGGGGGGGGGGSQTLSDRSGKQRTPQGRRRVRFTNNVSLYRFDSDGVDSAYSSSECERLYAPVSSVVSRRPGTPNRYPSTTTTTPSTATTPGGGGSALSSTTNRAYGMSDDIYGSVPRSVVGGRRLQDDNKTYTLSPPPPPAPPTGIIRQEVRAPQVLHGTPNGSLYLRNNHEKTKAVLPSAHWLGRTPPPTASSSQKQLGPAIVGSSGALRATSYTVISDTLTQERKLVVAAKLADSFHPNDITIKANKNGNKIRIVSIRSPPHPLQGQSRYQALNEQILLPVQVDPWRLTARLDPNGSLHIEAPCAD